MAKDKIRELLNQRIENGRTYRDMEIRASEGGSEEMRVEGYATTFGEYYELYKFGRYTFFERVDAHAFDNCDMRDVIMQYDHEGRVFARMSNKTLSCVPDDHGLLVKANLSGTELGRELYREIAGGYTTRMSFGFRIEDFRDETIKDTELDTVTIKRTITKISKLYDVSAVSLPANPFTEISARSWCDGVIAELEEDRRRAKEAQELRKKKISQIKILTEV